MSAPKVTVTLVARLVEILEATPDRWMSAADLATEISGKDTETNRRRVRAIASAAGSGVVSWPGSPGYALWKRCTVDELHNCVSAYSSQTDEMRTRRDCYRIRLHREHPATIAANLPELRPSEQQLALL